MPQTIFPKRPVLWFAAVISLLYLTGMTPTVFSPLE
jgi:hypothetical protein